MLLNECAVIVRGEALAEDLRLVVRLDAQSLSRVERSETFLQFAKDIFVHGITSPKSARPSMAASGPARHLRVFLSADCLGTRSPRRFSGLYPDAYWVGNDFCSGLGGALTACFHCRKRAVYHGPIILETV
jgi:hypothetical protein